MSSTGNMKPVGAVSLPRGQVVVKARRWLSRSCPDLVVVQIGEAQAALTSDQARALRDLLDRAVSYTEGF